MGGCNHEFMNQQFYKMLQMRTASGRKIQEFPQNTYLFYLDSQLNLLKHFLSMCYKNQQNLRAVSKQFILFRYNTISYYFFKLPRNVIPNKMAMVNISLFESGTVQPLYILFPFFLEEVYTYILAVVYKQTLAHTRLFWKTPIGLQCSLTVLGCQDQGERYGLFCHVD